MRLYSFQNFYLAGIHAGIQTAHTIARMSQKYALTEGFCNLAPDNDQEAALLFKAWATRGNNGETIIVKNGGMQCNLEETLAFLSSEAHAYPFDYFNESQEALGGALTNVSIVVPKRIWKFADALRAHEYTDYLAANTDGTVHYLVDAKTYKPLRFSYDHECGIQHRAFENNKLPIMNWEKISEQYGKTINGIFLTPSDFDRQLIARMNRCGLM